MTSYNKDLIYECLHVRPIACNRLIAGVMSAARVLLVTVISLILVFLIYGVNSYFLPNIHSSVEVLVLAVNFLIALVYHLLISLVIVGLIVTLYYDLEIIWLYSSLSRLYTQWIYHSINGFKAL